MPSSIEAHNNWRLSLCVLLVTSSLVEVSTQSLTAQHKSDLLVGGFQPTFEQYSEQQSSKSCKVNRISAYETVSGPVHFSTSTTEHLESPKIVPSINSSTWEQWEFDGTARSGKSGLIMGFSRDPSYAFFGQGNLRVEFYMVLEDGTIIQELDYLDESTIIECDDSITGVWNATDRQYAFRIPKDMSHTKVWWDTGRQTGSLHVESFTSPHLADGRLWPQEASTVALAPNLNFAQPIAGGKVSAELTVGQKKLEFTGLGGHGRLWASDGWFNICDGWHIVRAFAGPYALSYWEPISRQGSNRGVSFHSAQLFKDGKLLFATQVGRASTTADFVLFTPYSRGNLSGTLADKATGRVIELVSPERKRMWRFVLEHRRKKFEMGLGGGKGLTGFLVGVTGGEDAGEQFEGVGFSEQVTLPDEIKQWQIWLVYAVNLMGQWRHSVLAFMSRYI